MTSEWTESTIDHVTTLVTKGTTPTSIGGGFSENGIPFIKVESISESGRLIPDKFAFIDSFTDELLRRSRIQQDDVLFSIAGTIGRVALVNEEHGQMNTNQAVALVRPDTSLIEPRFLYYSLRDTTRIQVAKSKVVQSVQANFSLGELRQLKIDLPPRSDQKVIAHILGTLDDKIELNRRTNETLEAMAKAFFKSWFVDFDPVRAKAEGRPTGLPAEISDLFPDSFEDSELGEIPSGWKVTKLGDLYTIGKGGIWGDDTCSGDDFTEVSCLRGIDCHNLSSGSVPMVPSRWVKKSQVETRIPEDGAILIEGSGSFCGRSLLWEEKYRSLFERQVVYSNFCKRLTPACPKVYPALVWMALRDSYDRDEVANFRTGTAFPNLDVSGLLKGVSVVLPSEGIAAAFQDFYSLRNRVDLIIQSTSISDIRDALLPNLISGEIRIPDAEKMLEEIRI